MLPPVVQVLQGWEQMGVGQPVSRDHVTGGRTSLGWVAQASLALVLTHKGLKSDLWASIIRPCLVSGVTDFPSWLMLTEHSLCGRHCAKLFSTLSLTLTISPWQMQEPLHFPLRKLCLGPGGALSEITQLGCD